MPDRITAVDIPPALKRAIGVSAAACGLPALLLGPAYALVAPVAFAAVTAYLAAVANRTAGGPAPPPQT